MSAVASPLPGPSLDPIVAVIVAFETGAAIAPVLDRLPGEVAHAVVVDNSAGAETWACLQDWAARHEGFVTPLRNDVNNLARAQNRGVALALERGAGAVLLLDHDTRLEPGAMAAMRAWHAAQPAEARIGLIAARVVEPEREARLWTGHGWRVRRRPFGPDDAVPDLLFAIAAGSLIPRATLDAMGPPWFDESYGIDYVDVAFGLRLREAGWRLVALRDAAVQHRIGDRQAHRLGGLGFTATHHAAARRRTIWRNRARSWRRFGAREPGWALADMAAGAVDLARILAAEPDKRAKLGAALGGLFAGLALRDRHDAPTLPQAPLGEPRSIMGPDTP